MTKEIIHYSEEELKQLSDSELVSIIHKLNLRPVDLNQYLIRHIPALRNELIRRTSFLDLDFNNYRNGEIIPITARLYCISNGLNFTPRCSKEGCNRPVSWNKSKGIFREYCSGVCRSSDTRFKERIKTSKQTEDYIERMIEVNRNRSILMQSKEMRDRIKCTCLKNLGVEHPMKSKMVVEHRKEVWLKKLGCDNPMRSKKILEKRKQDFKSHFGVENPAQSTEVKHKISETHKSDECKAKINSTCEKLYGTKWYQQSDEYYRNRKWRYTNPKYPNMTFGSSWEFKVYDFLTEHNIPFEYQIESISYEYDGGLHHYIPDFRVNGKIYEVKGDNFFRINKETGQEEMFCPYRSDHWSNEQYVWMCGLYEAKHQCMLKHNVIILRGNDIKTLSMDTFYD